MKKTPLALAATLALTALPSVSFAEDASPLSFNLSVTSDYRYRGISQTRLKPALQGGADYALPGGFYIGAWASTIKWIRDWDVKGSARARPLRRLQGRDPEGPATTSACCSTPYFGNKLADVGGGGVFKNATPPRSTAR